MVSRADAEGSAKLARAMFELSLPGAVLQVVPPRLRPASPRPARSPARPPSAASPPPTPASARNARCR